MNVVQNVSLLLLLGSFVFGVLSLHGKEGAREGGRGVLDEEERVAARGQKIKQYRAVYIPGTRW